MRALKALAALLSYPTAELVEALPEIRAVVAMEGRIGRADRARLEALIREIAAADLLEAQEQYVALFDRGRATALNLYEHVHGDSRDRGQAMVDLAQVYARGGLALSTRELPDYLPVLLEYLSTRPGAEVEEMLRECAHLLRSIGEALARRGSAHAAVLGTLLAIAGEAGLEGVAVEANPEDEERPLDEEWAEEPVSFGRGCGDARADTGAAKPIRFVRKAA
jgi:nitrate reductase delta subunit